MGLGVSVGRRARSGAVVDDERRAYVPVAEVPEEILNDTGVDVDGRIQRDWLHQRGPSARRRRLGHLRPIAAAYAVQLVPHRPAAGRVRGARGGDRDLVVTVDRARDRQGYAEGAGVLVHGGGRARAGNRGADNHLVGWTAREDALDPELRRRERSSGTTASKNSVPISQHGSGNPVSCT
jgi:hypothetical protein